MNNETVVIETEQRLRDNLVDEPEARIRQTTEHPDTNVVELIDLNQAVEVGCACRLEADNPWF